MVAVPCRDLCNLGLESEPRTPCWLSASQFVSHFPSTQPGTPTLPGQGNLPAQQVSLQTPLELRAPPEHVGRGELPADVAGLKAEILQKQPWLGPQGGAWGLAQLKPTGGARPHAVTPSSSPPPSLAYPGGLLGERSKGHTLGSPPQRRPQHTPTPHLRKEVPRLQPPAPCSCCPPPPRPTQPWGPRPATTREPGGPVTQWRGWGLGEAGVCFWKAAARGSWGRVPHPPPPPEPGKPSASRDEAHKGTMGMAGRGESPPDKGPQAPPLASLPSSRCCASSLQGGSAGAGMGWGKVWTPRVTPPPTRVLAFLQVPQQSRNLPPSSLCRLGSLQWLPDAHQGALRTRAWPSLCSSVQRKQALGFSQAQRGLSRAGLCLLQRAMPTVERKLRH